MIKADTVIQNLDAVREQSPLVHNITNYVVMNVTANALLAVGASPVMAHAVEEMDEMTAIASALVLNIGTLSTPWIAAMERAVGVAVRRGIPIVIDPVGAGATTLRTETALNLIAHAERPVIRGNGSEILALTASSDTAGTKGVDSTVASGDSVKTAARFAAEHSCIVSISGETDYITDGESVLETKNGTALMTHITGTGCTATALTGAFASVNNNHLEAAACAMAVMGICGEIATEGADGPASMQVRFIDALYNIGADDIRSRLK